MLLLTVTQVCSNEPKLKHAGVATDLIKVYGVLSQDNHCDRAQITVSELRRLQPPKSTHASLDLLVDTSTLGSDIDPQCLLPSAIIEIHGYWVHQCCIRAVDIVSAPSPASTFEDEQFLRILQMKSSVFYNSLVQDNATKES